MTKAAATVAASTAAAVAAATIAGALIAEVLRMGISVRISPQDPMLNTLLSILMQFCSDLLLVSRYLKEIVS